MKITRRNLKRLIETFIVDPEGRTIDYKKLIELEKEYAKTHNPDLLKKIDALKAQYEDHPLYSSFGLDKDYPDDPYEKQTYRQADELEKSMRVQFGQQKGFDDEESELIGDLMGQYGTERGDADNFYNEPGKVPKVGREGGYPSKEERKKNFLDDRSAAKKAAELSKVYHSIDRLIGPYVDAWFDANIEGLVFDHSDWRNDLHDIHDIANEIQYDLVAAKGFDDFLDIIDPEIGDPEYSAAFESDEAFFDAIFDKVIEYGYYDDDNYILIGVGGRRLLGSEGKYYTLLGDDSGDPQIGYIG